MLAIDSIDNLLSTGGHSMMMMMMMMIMMTMNSKAFWKHSMGFLGLEVQCGAQCAYFPTCMTMRIRVQVFPPMDIQHNHEVP
jgi:hypothetical protein